MVRLFCGLLAATAFLSTAALAAANNPVDGHELPVRQLQSPSPSATGSSPAGGGDTTVTVTSNPSVVQTVTAFSTITSTIVVTSTSLVTSTVTSSNVAVATQTDYVTSTIMAKRWMIVGPPPETAPPVPEPTGAAGEGLEDLLPAAFTGADWAEIDLVRRKLENMGLLAKRAIVTQTVTGGKTITVVSTVTSTVISTTSSETIATSTILTTTFANAQTTTTVTSTIFVTTTVVTVTQSTVGNAPTGNYGTSTGPLSTPTNGISGDSGSSGLSTGAKAGIGAGVGAVGLIAIIAGLVYWYRRHRASRLDPNSLDDMGGMSEVPVGSPSMGGGSTLGASAAAAGVVGTAASSRVTSPRKSPLPMAGSTSPGMSTTDASYRAPSAGASELGGSTTMPAEIDSRPAMPQGPVYEMPAEPYR